MSLKVWFVLILVLAACAGPSTLPLLGPNNLGFALQSATAERLSPNQRIRLEQISHRLTATQQKTARLVLAPFDGGKLIKLAVFIPIETAGHNKTAYPIIDDSPNVFYAPTQGMLFISPPH